MVRVLWHGNKLLYPRWDDLRTHLSVSSETSGVLSSCLWCWYLRMDVTVGTLEAYLLPTCCKLPSDSSSWHLLCHSPSPVLCLNTCLLLQFWLIACLTFPDSWLYFPFLSFIPPPTSILKSAYFQISDFLKLCRETNFQAEGNLHPVVV